MPDLGDDTFAGMCFVCSLHGCENFCNFFFFLPLHYRDLVDSDVSILANNPNFGGTITRSRQLKRCKLCPKVDILGHSSGAGLKCPDFGNILVDK